MYPSDPTWHIYDQCGITTADETSAATKSPAAALAFASGIVSQFIEQSGN